MKLAYSTLACPGWSWKQAIEAARSYGYDGIEWRLIDGVTVSSEFPIQTCLQIKEAMLEAELATCALDSGISLALPPGPKREAAVAEGVSMLRLAKALGTGLVRMFPGTYPESVSDDRATAWAIEAVGRLLPEAQSLGVRIALEVHDSLGWDRRTTRGLSASKYTANVVDGLNTRDVGVLWDLGNPYLEGEEAAQSWRNVQGRLFHVHTKDMRSTAAGDWEYVAMGRGVLPLPEIIDWLQESGFAGWLSYEWEKKWHPNLAEPEVALPQYVEYMRACLAGR